MHSTVRTLLPLGGTVLLSVLGIQIGIRCILIPRAAGPLILYGADIRAGVYHEPVTPADLTVTLASMVDITLPSPDGHVLAASRHAGSGR